MGPRPPRPSGRRERTRRTWEPGLLDLRLGVRQARGGDADAGHLQDARGHDAQQDIASTTLDRRECGPLWRAWIEAFACDQRRERECGPQARRVLAFYPRRPGTDF